LEGEKGNPRVTGKRLKDFLAERRSVIKEKWFQEALIPYHSEEQFFLRSQKNEFANPVGATIRQALEGLYEALLEETDSGQVASLLASMIRIQAVQDFSPSRAVSFLPALKKIVRVELAREISEKTLGEELWQMDAGIDQWALLAFDLYMDCREKIFQIRLHEREKQKPA
jgi:hypothetical protein